MNTIRVVLLTFAIAWLFPACLFAASPDVTLKDVQGKPHHLSEYIGRGQWTVVTVWGPRCPPCVEEMPDLQKFHDDNQNGRAMVLGVAVDYPSFAPGRRDEVARFAENYFITFPLLLGSDEAFGRFGGGELMGVPTTVIYDRDGKLVARHVGRISAEMLERFIQKWDKTGGAK